MSPGFARPELLPWVLCAPVAWGVVRLLDARRDRRLAAALGPRAAALLAERSPRRRAARRAAFGLGVAALLAALAHPVFGARRDAPVARGTDVVLLLDVSRSMRARDVAPDRLGRAVAAVRGLVAHAAGDRLALVLYAGEARLAVPLTLDGAAVAEVAAVADPTSVARGGTDLGAALERALDVLTAAGRGPAAVIVLSDGEDAAGRADAAAARCAARGVEVHGLAVGTERGGKIPVEVEGAEAWVRDRAGADVVTRRDLTTLRRVAARTGGRVVEDDGTSADPLRDLHATHVAPRAAATGAAAGARARPDRYAVLVGLALLCGLVDLGLADRRRR